MEGTKSGEPQSHHTIVIGVKPPKEDENTQLAEMKQSSALYSLFSGKTAIRGGASSNGF